MESDPPSPGPETSDPPPDKLPKMRDVSLCPCKSRRPYGECCAPFHYGKALPQTAEALMRSRYSAYFFRRIDYLVDTTHPDKKTPHTRADIQALSDEANWKFLTILNTSKGQPGDKTGKVEFIAQYYQDGVLREHHEKSRFRKSRGLWKYVDDKG